MTAEKLTRIRELCSQAGYTTWDQAATLGEPPWDEDSCDEWESAHGHDPRIKCYPEYGCQLLVDPEDILAILDGP